MSTLAYCFLPLGKFKNLKKKTKKKPQGFQEITVH